MDDENDIFTRVFDIESKNTELTLYQKNVGDVNCVVWDAAIVLAKYLDILCNDDEHGKDWLLGKNVLELGSGVGLVGMATACLGAHTMVTDLEDRLSILEKNISMNKSQWEGSGGSVRAKALEWGDQLIFKTLDNFKPDIIMLSDCVYYPESIEPLINLLKNVCESNKNIYVLLSQELRDTAQKIMVWKNFMDNVKKYFLVEIVPRSKQHPIYSSDDIHIMKLTLLDVDQ